MTRRRTRDGPRFARWVGFALVAGALLAAGVRLAEDEPAREVVTIHPRPRADPLTAELLRCGELADPVAADERCRAAWAESRRRFLGPEPHRASPPSKDGQRIAPDAGQTSIHDRHGR